MSVWAVITQKLANDATLTQLLANGSQGVFYGRLPAHEALPFVHIQSVDGADVQYQAPAVPGSNIKYMEAVQAQIDCFAEDPGITLQVAKRIGALLDFQTPAGDDSGILMIRRTNSLDDVWMEDEPDEAVADVWRITILYDIWLQKLL